MLREELLSRPMLPTQTVTLPTFGRDVLVRALYGNEKDEFSALIKGKSGDGLLKACTVAFFAMDGSGQRLFVNDDAESIRTAWPDDDLEAVWKAVAPLIGFADKAVESAEKN
jgi:hypothetical protein